MTKRRIRLPDGSGEIEVEAHDAVPVNDQSARSAELRRRVEASLEANRRFVAITNPTPPQTSAQVKLLTEECTALIRLLIGRLDGTD